MKKFDNKPAGLISSLELKTFKGKFVYWFFFATMVIVCVVTLFPALWTLMTAFKDTNEIYESFSFFPKNMAPANLWRRISESWQQAQLGRTFLNTVVLSIGNVLFGVIIGGLAGYTLSKLKPKFSRIIFVLIVWTMMMPSQIRMVPNYIGNLNFPFASQNSIIPGINLLDTFWPMWLNAPCISLNIILFKNAFDGLSQSYVEAAQIDGCSNLGIFFKVLMPLAKPVIVYISIGLLTAAWSDFFGPLLYLNSIETTPLKIYRLQSDSTIQMNTRFMALIISSLPALIIFVIFQKQIIGGINIGGVKG